MNKTYFFTLAEVIAPPNINPTKIATGFKASPISVAIHDNTLLELADLLFYYVLEKYGEYYIYSVDVPWGDSYTLSNIDTTKVAHRMVSLFDLTCERYVPLLNSYNQYKTNPTAPLESSSDSKSRFNDTPQEDELLGDFNDDDHASNYTSSHVESRSDIDSISERLDKLWKNWRDIVRDWTNEFKGMFMEVF